MQSSIEEPENMTPAEMPEPTLDTPESLSEDLVGLCHRPVRAGDLRQAARLLLDWTGNCLAAVGEDVAASVRDAIGSGSGAGDCTAFATRDMPPEQAAFVNGALGTLLEMDDLHRASIMHAGDVVIPAALASAQQHQASGETLLEAIVFGYEVALRLGTAAAAGGYAAWYNSATCGVFGAAMAAAHAAGGSDQAKVDALGQAGMQAAGLWQCRLEVTDSKVVATGHAARAGVSSALLALRQVRGACHILEGPLGFFPTFYPEADVGDVLRQPDAAWLIHEVSFKPWSACRHVHPAVGLAMELRSALEPDRIDRVRLQTYAAAVEFCDCPDPQSACQARFSLQHCVAVALLTGDLRIEDSQPGALSHPAVANLRKRIEIEDVQAFTDAFPVTMGAKLEVMETCGTTHVAQTAHAPGDPESPMDDEDLVQKFRANLEWAGVCGSVVDDLAATICDLPRSRTLDQLKEAFHRVVLPGSDAPHTRQTR